MFADNFQISDPINRMDFHRHFGPLLDPTIESKMVPCEDDRWMKGDLLLMRKDKIHLGPGRTGESDRSLIFFDIVPERKPSQEDNTQLHGIIAAQLYYGFKTDEFYNVAQMHKDYYQKSTNYLNDPLEPVLDWGDVNECLLTYAAKRAKKSVIKHTL